MGSGCVGTSGYGISEEKLNHKVDIHSVSVVYIMNTVVLDSHEIDLLDLPVLVPWAEVVLVPGAEVVLAPQAELVLVPQAELVLQYLAPLLVEGWRQVSA